MTSFEENNFKSSKLRNKLKSSNINLLPLSTDLMPNAMKNHRQSINVRDIIWGWPVEWHKTDPNFFFCFWLWSSESEWKICIFTFEEIFMLHRRNFQESRRHTDTLKCRRGKKFFFLLSNLQQTRKREIIKLMLQWETGFPLCRFVIKNFLFSDRFSNKWRRTKKSCEDNDVDAFCHVCDVIEFSRHQINQRN